MKVIFLDVDGVLNCRSTEARCGHYIGIDDDKVQRLRQIVDATGAVIMLVSSWKDGWDREYKEDQDALANYLDRKLNAAGMRILDKTEDNHHDRGAGILRWTEGRPVESFVILDDCLFDYREMGLLSRLVETTEGADDGGLQDVHVQRAIEILNATADAENSRNMSFYRKSALRGRSATPWRA